MKYRNGDGVSRREFVKNVAKSALVAGGAGLLGAERVVGGMQVDPCSWSRDVALVNGRFYDESGFVGSALAIQDGRIVGLGEAGDLGPCARSFDLGGRTVIPGLIDSHAHFTRTGTNPGHEARGIEASFSIEEIQEVVSRRSVAVPPGQFITCMGGWNELQLEEKRLPTKTELDEAAPRHAVYLQPSGRTEGVTNSTGANFFTSREVEVTDVGGVSTRDASNALQMVQTAEDKLRGTREAIAYAAGLGLTMVHCMGNLTDQPDDYQFMTRLYRGDGGNLGLRMRFYRFFKPDEGIPELLSHISAASMPTSDGVLRQIGLGEFIPRGEENFMAGCRIAAERGWTLTQHSNTVEENQFHVEAFRAANAVSPIADLRWSIAHVFAIESDVIEALKDLGAGVLVQSRRYMDIMDGGPPFRTLVDSGIRIGAGTDSTNPAPLNPWLALFYMVTGRDLAGDVINDGQQISRTEALRLYTTGSAWFSRDDQDLGTIAAGKLADLAVLNEDYFTIPEDRIRKLSSVLTFQAGRIVHATGEFAQG